MGATVEAAFTTGEQVTVVGPTQTRSMGGLDLRWTGDAEVELVAEEIELRMEYQRGQRIGSEEVLQHRQTEDSGVAYLNASEARVGVERWAPEAQVFAEPAGPDARVSAEQVGTIRHSPISSQALLARGGYSDTRAGVNPDNVPSYNYRTEDPLVREEGPQEATVEGSFQLFVHNATISVDHAGGSWENWTGFRESQTAEGVREYELRVTVIEVENGTLTTGSDRGLSLLGPSLRSHVDGDLQAEQAHGRILRSGDSVLLDGSDLHLAGNGVLDVDAQEGPDGEAYLRGTAEGDYELVSLGAEMPRQDQGATGGPVWWLGLGLLLVVGVTILVHRWPVPLRALPSGARHRLYEHWLETGRDREDERAFAGAARFYRRATALEPARPTGWYRWARALIEAGEHGDALDVLGEADTRLAEPPLDLLELEVAAAENASRRERAKEALVALAEASPVVARGLIEDLDLDRYLEDDDVQSALGDRESGGLRGYV